MFVKRIWFGFLFIILISAKPFAQEDTGNVQKSLKLKGDNIFSQQNKFKIPDYRFINDSSNVYEIIYEGPEYEGEKTGVFAYYSNPDLLRGRSPSGDRFPGIVLLHGGGGTAFREWVELWSAEGFAAIAMDMSGSGKDRLPLKNGGPPDDSRHKFNEIAKGPRNTWSYYSVKSIIRAHSLLRSFTEVDSANTFLTGISWGGYLTCLIAGVDTRYKAAAPVYGCGYFDELEGPEKQLNNLSTQQNADWLKYLDPSVYLPHAQCKMFFVNGNKDFFFSLGAFHKTYKLIPDSNKKISIIPDLPHNHYWGWEIPELRYFFKSFINEDIQLPGVSFIEMQNDEIRCGYESLVSLYQADFFYTMEHPSNKDSKWKSVKMLQEPGLLTLNVKNISFRSGFVQITDNRGLRISSELIIVNQ